MLFRSVSQSRYRPVERAFKVVDIEICWQGEGINERGVNRSTGEVLVIVDEKYFRPAEVELLWGDPSLANKKLGWSAKTSFEELVNAMVTYDLNNDDYGGNEIL